MMKGHRILTLAVLGLIGTTLPLDAQARAGARGPQGTQMERPTRSVEPTLIAVSALRLRDRLELTEAQIESLEAIRDQSRAVAGELRDEMQSVRDEIRGGDVTRNEIRARMEALGERREEASAPLRQQLDDVLTAEQQARLRQVMVRQAAVRQGARGAQPARGAQRARAGRGGTGGPAARGPQGTRDARVNRLRSRVGPNRVAPAGRDRAAANRPGRAVGVRPAGVLNRGPIVRRQNTGVRRGR